MKRKILFVVALCPILGLAAWPAAALAAAPSAVGGVAQTLLGLVAVLAAIVGLAWLLRRAGRLPAGAQSVIRVLGGARMGARERVVLVQVGETQMLLGVAPGRVQTLHVFAQPAVAVRDREPPLASAFSERLLALLKQRGQS
jgi:flagellar protein FliO/FliZ